MSSHFQLPTCLVGGIIVAGAPVQVNAGAELPCRSAMFVANPANAATVYIGTSAATATAASGINLNAGEAFPVEGDQLGKQFAQFDLAKFWIDGANPGDSIQIIYMLDGNF